MVLKDLGDLAGARERLERAIEIDEQHFDSDHPSLAIRYWNLGWVLLLQGEKTAALVRFKRAHEIWLGKFGPDDRRTKMARDALAKLAPDQSDEGPDSGTEST